PESSRRSRRRAGPRVLLRRMPLPHRPRGEPRAASDCLKKTETLPARAGLPSQLLRFPAGPLHPALLHERVRIMPSVTELGDALAGLTLVQAVELKNYLKDKHGIEPAAGGVAMVAGPAAGGGAA